MEEIVRIQGKILEHLLKLRKADPELYFAPRKINNKDRLNKGYWFIGNDQYVCVSFWNGGDSKEKIHNINFVVLKNKASYLELSSQDSPVTARFLEKLTAKLGGFQKVMGKNKWFKYYSGTNYLGNLDSFIQSTKPEIDKQLRSDRIHEIQFLDLNYYNKYVKPLIERWNEQIESGKTNKVCRICWNTENWKFPSGSQGKSFSENAYEANSGFGHEEWLFDKSRIINGYHYAFLQPLFLKSDTHDNQTYNISLITINNLNKKYFVGEIKSVECINRQESERAYKIYKSNGWIEQMREDIERVGANHQEFNDTVSGDFFNIRFKYKNVSQPEEMVELAYDDINLSTNRYKLLPKKAEISLGIVIDDEENESEGNKKSTTKRKKVFNSETEFDPYHDIMQNAIFDLLHDKRKYNYRKVCIERGRVDIKALTMDEKWHYFELKTDNAKLSIRKALGQILEYACFPDQVRAEKLIIVGDEIPNTQVIEYLNHIRSKFDLPISYRHFDLEMNNLSTDY